MTPPPTATADTDSMAFGAPLPSAQVTAEGASRFAIPAAAGHPDWAEAVACESAGGVAAEGRVFLDEQLGTGDLVLDLDPGFGFVALGAATAPNGVPTVLVAEPDADRLMALQDAAADAGAWVEPLDDVSPAGLAEVVDARLESEARVFVHLTDAQLEALAEPLQSLVDAGRLLAVLMSAIDADHWEATAARLAAIGLQPCGLAAGEDGTVLMPVTESPVGTLIAVPRALFADEVAASEETAPSTSSVSSTPMAAPAEAAPMGRILREGFNFIAPHQRTGYGVAGANLLRALQRLGVPVAWFPMGAVDATLTDNPLLERAFAAQAAFPTRAPSVRLSQALDLAMHAGTGPRVGFPIFESEVFSARELHHLRTQDALLVCTPWAREVCRANGLDTMPIHVVPLGADPGVYHPDVPAVRRGDETVFLHVGKLEARKGQQELLRAFEAAFTPADPVRLVLACHNPFLSRDAFEAQLAPFRRSPMARRITLQTTELPTATDVASLMASADCGVFPARAEGWNLELVEMLAMAKPVIATHATAHTAYLTPENARLITLGAPEPASAGGLLGQWGSWGDAQHEQLVTALREVHAAKQADRLGLNLAGLATARSLTWDASAEALVQALESLG